MTETQSVNQSSERAPSALERPGRASRVSSEPSQQSAAEAAAKQFEQALQRHRAGRGKKTAQRPAEESVARQAGAPVSKAAARREEREESAVAQNQSSQQTQISGQDAPSGRDGAGQAEAVKPQSAAGSYAADAEAFADFVARQTFLPNRDPRRLKLAFAESGWPLSEIHLATAENGRLTITLGAPPHELARLEERLGQLREKLEERGLCGGDFELVAAPESAEEV